MPASHQGYSSGKFALELDGSFAGFLHSVEGGEVIGVVAEEPAGPGSSVRKHIENVKWEPIRIAFGAGMSEEFYAWVSDFFVQTPATREGAILLLDFQLKEMQRIEWRNGLLTEVTFPELNASSKADLLLSIVINPESTTLLQSKGKVVSGVGGKKQKKWQASNFRFNLSGLEAASKRVKRIEALTFRRSVAADSASGIDETSLIVPNPVVTLPAADAVPYFDWTEDFLVQGDNDQDAERSGSIEILDPTLKDTQLTLELNQVGIVRARRLRTQAESNVVAEVEVELYCESSALTIPLDNTATGSVSPPLGESATTVPPNPVTDALLSLLLGDGVSDAVRSRLSNALGSESPGSADPELRSRRVAARLQTTAAPPRAAFSSKREDGVALGARWASERAALSELEEIGQLETGEWTALRLGSDHSLIAHLQEANLIPADAGGAFELERDDFAQGLVAGAAKVLRSATPYLKPATGTDETQKKPER